MVNKKSKIEFQAICSNCGHDHVAITGDSGRNHDEVRYELMDECCYCNCEHFKSKRKKQNGN